MNIEELKIHKQKVECRIRDEIQRALSEFRTLTGLSPNMISVHLHLNMLNVCTAHTDTKAKGIGFGLILK